MSYCATGGTEPIAVLFKTNALKNFNLRYNLFFAARAWTEERGDRARRTLFFPVRTMSREERTDVAVIAAEIQDSEYRRTLQLETVVRLQLVLRAMNAIVACTLRQAGPTANVTLAEMVGTTRFRVSVFMDKFRKLGLRLLQWRNQGPRFSTYRCSVLVNIVFQIEHTGCPGILENT
jgi:hypothetical protein